MRWWESYTGGLNINLLPLPLPVAGPRSSGGAGAHPGPIFRVDETGKKEPVTLEYVAGAACPLLLAFANVEDNAFGEDGRPMDEVAAAFIADMEIVCVSTAKTGVIYVHPTHKRLVFINKADDGSSRKPAEFLRTEHFSSIIFPCESLLIALQIPVSIV